jgi:hypothetical protein
MVWATIEHKRISSIAVDKEIEVKSEAPHHPHIFPAANAVVEAELKEGLVSLRLAN